MVFGMEAMVAGALLFVYLAAVAELRDEYDIGGLDAVEHTVVADAEATGAWLQFGGGELFVCGSSFGAARSWQ